MPTTVAIALMCAPSCGAEPSDLIAPSSDWIDSTIALVWFSRKSCERGR